MVRNFVDGAVVDAPHETFERIYPVDGSVTALGCTEADAATVDAAVNAARAALTGPGGSMTVQERAAVLRRVADELERRFDDLVAAEVGDTGKSSARRGRWTSRAARPTSGRSPTSATAARPSRTRP